MTNDLVVDQFRPGRTTSWVTKRLLIRGTENVTCFKDVVYNRCDGVEMLVFAIGTLIEIVAVFVDNVG